MATYEINFSALNTAKGNLENTLNELQQQMKKLDEIQETMLSDSSWKGPNKSRFRKVLMSIRQHWINCIKVQ